MESYVCAKCENEVSEILDFCPYCGNIFLENINCVTHPESIAMGACLICEEAYCSECGGYVNEKFLCAKHETYEIYESMAKVFGKSDAVYCNYLADVLKQSDIKAIVYSRKVSPISIGGGEYSLFRASGEYKGHLINEFKVMVPLSDVLNAERIIGEIEKSGNHEFLEDDIL